MISVPAIMLHFENSLGKKKVSFLSLQNLKTFKITPEQDSLMTCHNFFDLSDAD
jgi:hypothetical protein